MPVPDIARTLFLLRPGELLVAGENPDVVLDVIRACGSGASSCCHPRVRGRARRPFPIAPRAFEEAAQQPGPTGPSCGREALIPKHSRRRTWFARSRREPRRPGTPGCRRSTIPCAAGDWSAKPELRP
jgi:hypothetical protein